ncbi:MAG: AtpZ/AtpI family protein [Alphaproteobacteria bacterium]
MADPHDTPPSLDELQKRIDALEPDKDSPVKDSPGAAYSKGMRMGVDLLAGAGVGLVMGYYIDEAAGTAPAFLILFFFLGFAAGVRNILRNVDKV